MRKDLVKGAMIAVKHNLLEERIDAALEWQPEVAVDANFAARVVARVPRRRYMRTLAPVTGRRVAAAVLVALLLALTVLAPASHSRLAVGFEWCLLAEFLMVAVWLGMTSARSSR